MSLKFSAYKPFIFSVLVLLFGIISCSKPHYYSQTVEVPGGQWHYDSLVRFVVPIHDTSYYRIYIKIVHDEQYPYANLWMRVILKCPCGAVRIDTVNFWLVDSKQRWIGTAIGKNWTVILPYQDSVRFPSTGDMNFFIQHIMRKDDVPHIKEIGLIIDKLN